MIGYFFIQAIGSILLLFFVLVDFSGFVGVDFFSQYGCIYWFIVFCLVLKLGLGPFYLWYIYVINRLR